MTSYLFLDIDGVISLYGTKSGFRSLNKQRIRNLRDVVRATGCHIVISSTWRLYPEMMSLLRRRFAYKGLSIFGRTPILLGVDGQGKRGEEIKTWLDDYAPIIPYTFAIVDDMERDQFVGKDFDFSSNFVQTNPNQGLTKEKAAAIIDILNGS